MYTEADMYNCFVVNLSLLVNKCYLHGCRVNCKLYIHRLSGEQGLIYQAVVIYVIYPGEQSLIPPAAVVPVEVKVSRRGNGGYGSTLFPSAALSIADLKKVAVLLGAQRVFQSQAGPSRIRTHVLLHYN